MNIERPILQWHGGKWVLASWIIPFFPDHRVYVEPFGGAASVLLQKKRTHTEVYNDLDDEVVNLFQVMRGPEAKHLVEQLRYTPFSRREFRAAYEPTMDPVERARRLVIRSFMGHGTSGHAMRRTTGFRSNAAKANTSPAMDWRNHPDQLELIVDRLRGVVVEQMDAFKLIAKHDAPGTLFYIDPPYLPETRDKGDDYVHELTQDQHRTLLDTLVRLKGMVVLSGYPSALYDDALVGWTRHDRNAHADGGRDRVECIWLNPACVDAKKIAGLFDAESARVNLDALPDENGDDVPYEEFQALVQKQLGTERGWQMAFSRISKVNIMTVQSWRIRGLVPPRYFHLATTLSPDSLRCLDKLTWTDPMRDRLWSMMTDGVRRTNEQIANALSEEFGQTVSISAIKPAKHRLKAQRSLPAPDLVTIEP
ncbi:MAG: DNA adenine methylase [Verrucomicrobiaceae bacterium]|nr:MAG: DNA adenine methylase [Verrucomicrobiaceae bacterium]